MTCAKLYTGTLFLCLIVATSGHFKYIMASNGLDGVALVEYGRQGIIVGECIYDTPDGEEVRIVYEQYSDFLQAATEYEDNTNTEFHLNKCRVQADAFSQKKLDDDEKFRSVQLPLPLEERQNEYHKSIRRMQLTQRAFITFISTSNNGISLSLPSIFHTSSLNFTKIWGK